MNSTSPPRRTLAETFAGLRSRGEIGLLPFIAAGYPDLETTACTITALEGAGASAIEIGLPFSDPVADGPVIQEAFTAALANHVRLMDVLDCVKEVRGTVSLPLVAMGSYSLVYRFGEEKFFAQAKAAGIDALILPDLPPPEAQSVCAKVRQAGLDTILLIAPTTSAARRREIADLCSGFVYYLAVSGITGERKELPAELAENLSQLRQMCKPPICVGFGISQAQHVAQLAGLADGAIVGSAMVRRMKEHAGAGPKTIAAAAADFCRELLHDVR